MNDDEKELRRLNDDIIKLAFDMAKREDKPPPTIVMSNAGYPMLMAVVEPPHAIDLWKGTGLHWGCTGKE